MKIFFARIKIFWYSFLMAFKAQKYLTLSTKQDSLGLGKWKRLEKQYRQVLKRAGQNAGIAHIAATKTFRALSAQENPDKQLRELASFYMAWSSIAAIENRNNNILNEEIEEVL